VLMDVQMPGMDGIETTARIREREKLTGDHVPVLALTAYAMPGDRARCLAAGMDGYLTKPIQPATLLDAVARLQPRRAEPREKKSEKRILDRDALLESVEDAQLLAEIVEAFSGACGNLMSRAREAMESGDAERLGVELHTLQGMFRSLSAVAALDEARKLESLAAGDRDEARAIYASLEREVQALAGELAALSREASNRAATTGVDSAKKNPGERRGRLNAQREGGARGFQG